MKERDKGIIKAVETFRALNRDDIHRLFFREHKQLSYCNIVLKRLVDRGYLQANKKFKPTIYTLPGQFKKNSQKIPHFHAIYRFYCDVCRYETPIDFTIEPKLAAKGTVEPDIFMTFNNITHYVEIQRTKESEQSMNEKLRRYEQFFSAYRQQVIILMITNKPYKLNTFLYVYQCSSFDEYLKLVAPQFVSSGWHKLK